SRRSSTRPRPPRPTHNRRRSISAGCSSMALRVHPRGEIHMSDSQGLVIVERKGAIATITVNRPEKLNALNSQVIGELIRKFHELLVPGEGQVPVRCAILTGVGEK